MPIIATNMKNTNDWARLTRFEPSVAIPATDVQTAIEQVSASVSAPIGYTPTVVTSAMSPYAPLLTDSVLLVNTSVGPVTIQMPLSAARLGAKGYVPLTVKDDTGNADANNISVLRSGAETIDGLTTYLIDSKFTAITFMPKAAGGYDAI